MVYFLYDICHNFRRLLISCRIDPNNKNICFAYIKFYQLKKYLKYKPYAYRINYVRIEHTEKNIILTKIILNIPLLFSIN